MSWKLTDLGWGQHQLSNASRVRIRWLGTAGFELACDGHVVLIDPYLTRASLRRCVMVPLRSDAATVRRYITAADAIVCGHTHFDHVLDVPTIARLTGGKVYGSRSAVNLCRAAGIDASQLADVESPGRATTVEVGPFRLRFVPSAHSPFLFGRVPLEGDISDCDEVPLRTNQYRCGAVFGVLIEVAGRTLYHVGSANLAQRPPVPNVDLLLLCTAGWHATRDFPRRMLSAVSPGAVLLSHWDNFFTPIERSATALPAIRARRLVDELLQHERSLPIGTVPMLADLWL